MAEFPPSIREQLISRIRTSLFADFDEVFASALNMAYGLGHHAGFQAGADRMREAILKAAQEPVAPQDPQNVLSGPDYGGVDPALIGSLVQQKLRRPSEREPNARAPRGSVRNATVSALIAKPGSNEQEIGALANHFDPLVSVRSVGGELRRLKGRLYCQRGSQWFLMGELVQFGLPNMREAAQPNGSTVPQPQKQEDSDTSETAIAT